MTVSTTTTIWSYAGDDVQTVFPYAARIYAASDLEVYRREADGIEVLLTLDVDYSVSGVGVEGGGNVTTAEALATGQTLIIKIVLAYTQETAIPELGLLPTEAMEIALDRGVKLAQQLKERFDRCPRLTEAGPVTEAVFPGFGTGSAPKYVRWNALGTALEAVEAALTGTLEGGVYYAAEYGALGLAAIQAAVAQIAGAKRILVLSPGVWEIGAACTLPANITLMVQDGAVLTRTAGDHLTINGRLVANRTQIFADNTVAGDWVVLGPGAATTAYPEWWGASGAAADQAGYINMAIIAMYQGGNYGWVLITQDLQINTKVKLYPKVGFDMLPGVKLTAAAAVTMLGSYQPTVKTYNFRMNHIGLEGASLAPIGLDLTGMSQSFLNSWIIDNCDEPLYCDHTVGGAYNNALGSGTVSGAVNGVNLATNELSIEALRVLGASAYGVKLNGAGIQIGQLHTISCPTQVQFLGANNVIGMLYIEDGVSTVYGIEWAAGSNGNRVKCIQYDAGHVLPNYDLAVYPNGYGNEIESIPLLSRTAVNLIKNGDMMQWGSATVPLGFTGTNTSKATLNHQEKAVSLDAAVGAAAALHQGTPGAVLGPAWLPTAERSLVVGLSYLRRTVAMEGYLVWRISLRFYDALNNLLQTHDFPYVSWETVINDSEPTFYTNRVGIPAGAVTVGWDLNLTAATGATEGSLIVRDVVVNQGINLSTIPVQFERTHYLAATPTTGTWDLYDEILHATPTNLQPGGWRVATAGTMGTLSGVTGGITSGTALLTVNSVADLYPGAYISIAGVTGTKRILSIDGLVCTLDSVADATVSGAAVAYVAATFLKMANLAT